MSLSDSIKTVLVADGTFNGLMTGGIHNDVEEISKTGTPSAFDADTKEIKPCCLIKLGTEIPLVSGFLSSVQTPVTLYLYQRSGYSVIEPAIDQAFTLLNEAKIGTRVWRIEFDTIVHQQRDTALDCALASLRFVAKRLR